MEDDKPQHTSDDEPCKLPYEFIKKITNDFDKKQILGSGGFGTVYKGVHDTRGEIAVKVLHNMSGLDDKEFHKEFNNLRGLKHQNIVELVGFCKESEEELAEFDGKQVTATRLHMALCFEYVHNGSLDKHISDEYTGFNWPTRYGIIKGICEGLKYLREGLESPIMHFDLKPDNILLNKNMVPKIADFGLSELFGKDNTTKAVNSVGTCGYWPPEYINHQIISREFDIFSLGVIIVKIMTGHGGYNSIVEMMTQKSVKLVHESWKRRIHKTVSHTLFEVYSHQVKRCIEIALDCLKSNRHERPTIHDILSSLNETETIIGGRAMYNEQFYQENGEPTLPCENSSITIDCVPSSGNGQDSMSTHTENFLPMEPRAMPFCVLKKITDNFSRERLLSRHRRYGHVFKGVCEDGQVIIVRTFGVRRGFEETNMQELVTLVKVHHQNIVQLVGYCWEKREIVVPCEGRYVYAPQIRTFMCFEYLPNGSLDRYISDISSGLDWHTRYGIIKGICAGLKCLHEGLNNPGIHMNLKLSNILLDENMMPKISKFGIQRILGEEKGRSTDDIHPSDLTPDDHRHMPPEFIQRQVISKAFDIYSLGVIVIELMTGTRLGFLDTNLLEISSEEFIEQAQEEWRQRLQKTGHVTLVEGYCKQVVKCLEIGLKCVERDRHSRPAITNIVNMLNETETFIRSEWLDVYPRNLCFGLMMWRWEPYKKSMFSCTLELKNKGNDRIAFMLVAKNPKKYLTKKPLCGIVPPRCAYILTITMMPHTQNMPLDINDFFTLYSIAVSQYDLPDVKKDSILVQYSNFFKAKEKVARDEVQEVTATPDAQQVSFIDVHPTEPWIMTTNHMGSLRLWNYKTMPDSLLVYKDGLMQMEMLNYSQLVAYEPVHTAKFIARERWLIAGDRNGDIHVYNYNQNQHVTSFDAHNSCITILSVHPTDPFFLSSSDDDDHLIKLWNWKKKWECTRTFQGHTDSVTEVTFNPENKDSFASASSDGTVKIWSICSHDLCNIITLKLDGRVESLLSIDYFTRYNRQHLIVGSKGRSAQIWKLGMTGCVDMLEGHADTISAVNSHPEFPVLITGSLDGTVRIWNSTTYKLENIIGFNLGAVYALGCITGTRRIVAGCHQGIGTMELSPP